MMRGYPSAAGERYVKSLQNAYAKGAAAAEDPQFTDRNNPYQRYEQRKSWAEGFRDGRAALVEPLVKRPDPMF